MAQQTNQQTLINPVLTSSIPNLLINLIHAHSILSTPQLLAMSPASTTANNQDTPNGHSSGGTTPIQRLQNKQMQYMQQMQQLNVTNPSQAHQQHIYSMNGVNVVTTPNSLEQQQMQAQQQTMQSIQQINVIQTQPDTQFMQPALYPKTVVSWIGCLFVHHFEIEFVQRVIDLVLLASYNSLRMISYNVRRIMMYLLCILSNVPLLSIWMLSSYINNIALIWFVLRGNYMTYYKTNLHTQPKSDKCVNLLNYKVNPIKHEKSKYAFELISPPKHNIHKKNKNHVLERTKFILIPDLDVNIDKQKEIRDKWVKSLRLATKGAFLWDVVLNLPVENTSQAPNNNRQNSYHSYRGRKQNNNTETSLSSHSSHQLHNNNETHFTYNSHHNNTKSDQYVHYQIIQIHQRIRIIEGNS